MIKVIVLSLLITLNLFSLDKIYFLPSEAKDAKNKIEKLIDNAYSNIDIAMYNMSYKKFHKALKKAVERGVDVTLIYEKSKLKLSNKINLLKTDKKQHIKLAIIDNKFVVFGSANWKKESFGSNYEIIQISDNKKLVHKFVQIFKKLKSKSHH